MEKYDIYGLIAKKNQGHIHFFAALASSRHIPEDQPNSHAQSQRRARRQGAEQGSVPLIELDPKDPAVLAAQPGLKTDVDGCRSIDAVLKAFQSFQENVRCQ